MLGLVYLPSGLPRLSPHLGLSPPPPYQGVGRGEAGRKEVRGLARPDYSQCPPETAMSGAGYQSYSISHPTPSEPSAWRRHTQTILYIHQGDPLGSLCSKLGPLYRGAVNSPPTLPQNVLSSLSINSVSSRQREVDPGGSTYIVSPLDLRTHLCRD